MSVGKNISAYHAQIGRIGGSKSSPAKRRAARMAALKRWGHRDPALPPDELVDRTWYIGRGRNADIGLWDAAKRMFWVTCITEPVSPATYPAPGPRSVRLKRERHYDEGGTFRPTQPAR